jgi:mannitol/fructose-specific phosphotransferase system IIA component (Ntr-type)
MLRLIDIITEKGIIPRLKAKNREEAIIEILDRLVESGRLPDQHLDDIGVEILKRETLGSTGIGSGVAIPHIKTEHVSSFVGALAVAPEGLEFNSIDKSPVRLIILFLSPNRAVSGHLQLLSHIGGILRHQGYVQLLSEAKSHRELLELVKDAERMIFGIGPGGDESPSDDEIDAVMA